MADGLVKLVLEGEKIKANADTVCVVQIGGLFMPLTREQLLLMMFGHGAPETRRRATPGRPPRQTTMRRPALKQVIVEILRRHGPRTTPKLREILEKAAPDLANGPRSDLNTALYELEHHAELIWHERTGAPWHLTGQAPKRLPAPRRAP